MPLEISPSKVGSITLVNLRGTIVAGNDRGMLLDKMKELLEAGERDFILDLGQVTYVDNTGVGALIEALNLAARKGGGVKLLHLTKQIYDVLQIAELSAVFGIYDDLQKALESFEA
ncbi:MAG: STAS domain-containing protein [Terriglobia bacterium]|jgi:anti-sigma B factor antagonist